MRQITKTLAVAIVLVWSSMSTTGFANDEPPASRLRTWSDICSSKDSERSAAPQLAVVREMPAMPGFAVQVGAFGDIENAKRLILSLKGKGLHHIFLKKSWVSGKPFYKVVVGPFRERINAANRRDEIKQFYGVSDGFVVIL